MTTRNQHFQNAILAIAGTEDQNEKLVAAEKLKDLSHTKLARAKYKTIVETLSVEINNSAGDVFRGKLSETLSKVNIVNTIDQFVPIFITLMETAANVKDHQITDNIYVHTASRLYSLTNEKWSLDEDESNIVSEKIFNILDPSEPVTEAQEDLLNAFCKNIYYTDNGITQTPEVEEKIFQLYNGFGETKSDCLSNASSDEQLRQHWYKTNIQKNLLELLRR